MSSRKRARPAGHLVLRRRNKNIIKVVALVGHRAKRVSLLFFCELRLLRSGSNVTQRRGKKQFITDERRLLFGPIHFAGVALQV